MIYELGWEQLGIIDEKSHLFRKLIIKHFTSKTNSSNLKKSSKSTLNTLVPKIVPSLLVMPSLSAISPPDNDINPINKKVSKPSNVKKSYT